MKRRGMGGLGDQCYRPGPSVTGKTENISEEGKHARVSARFRTKIASAETPRTAMETAYICDAIRTPFGRYGGMLASIRTDDLAAIPLTALVERTAGVHWHAVEHVVYGYTNQDG